MKTHSTKNLYHPILKPLFAYACIVTLTLLISLGAHAEITNIQGVYIEKQTSLSAPATPNGQGAMEPYRITETNIEDGDVIAFDIPGFNAYLQENGKSLRNVTLLIGNAELKEFPAFIENTESDVVRFIYLKDNLSTETRTLLYKLPGRTLKKALIGIKIDEEKSLFYSDAAQLYLKEFEYRGIFCWGLIALFVVFFLFLVFKFDKMIKDSFNPDQGTSEENTYFSFSKSQFAFWTFIILASFIYIWALSGDLTSINTTALILLGITSATISVGNLIGKNEEKQASTLEQKMRLEQHRVKSSETKTNFLQDILSDENGISIHRLQAVVFNLVFGIAFFHHVLVYYSMPEFSETQLILLGLSSGTYAFLKSSELK